MKKNKYILELCFVFCFYILFAQCFEAIIYPLMKKYIIDDLSLKLIIIEMLKFIFINLIIYKIKNESIKKLLMFLSIFVYISGANILMFILTLLFQKSKENIKNIDIFYTYAFTLAGIILNKYKTKVITLETFKISYAIAYTVLYLMVITFFIYKKNGISLKPTINFLSPFIMGIIMYLTLFHNEETMDYYLVYVDYDYRLNIISIILIALLFLFYYFSISIYDREINILLYASFFYFITYPLMRFVISYKIMGIIILIYTIFLIIDKKIKIVDKLKIEIEKYKKKFK